MSENRTNMYDLEAHISEIYDQGETYTDDLELIRELVGGRGPLRILEPFCGSGRTLIPLARDGHELVGLDQAGGMLARAAMKIGELPGEVGERTTLIQADITGGGWPTGFDLVILGSNCFYELATPEEQGGCIASAAAALEQGGWVYVDNAHMDGELDASWQVTGMRPGFPTGVCSDGTRLESTIEAIWWDAPKRLVRFRRHTQVIRPDGEVVEETYIQQKHPVSAGEVGGWLDAYGFVVDEVFGDRQGTPFNENTDRAIFWARKL